MVSLVPVGLERNDIRFDELEHQYYKDGKPVPSVTQVLQVAGVIPEYKGPLDYGYYGDEIHDALAAIDAGLHIRVRQDIEGVIKQYMAFIDDWYNVLGIEFIVYSSLGYAGRCDRLIDVPGVGLVVLDIKSGAYKPWHALQNAGYAIAINECGLYKVTHGGNLYITDDSYDLKLYELDGAIESFKDALNKYKMITGVQDGSS